MLRLVNQSCYDSSLHNHNRNRPCYLRASKSFQAHDFLLKKGGNPSTRSRTDALLRLNPNHLPHLRPTNRTSGVGDSHGLTGGVYKTRERIHRNMLICDY